MTISNRRTLAGIDIGSNAIRFIINNVETIDGNFEFKKIAFLRVPIRLGEDVFTAGTISDDKKDRLIYALEGFNLLMKAYNVQSYMACATSAMRDARNGNEITSSLYEKTGLKIDIISGEEEAEMIFQAGGLTKVMDKERNYLYVDVGGGSTEIVVYSNHKKVTSASFQMGTVRMLVDAVDKKSLKNMKKWLSEINEEYPKLSIIGSGGNINKLFKMLNKREGESILFIELDNTYKTIKDLSIEERIEKFGFNDYRADVIEYALKIFRTIAKTCDVNEIFVPKLGLVDGIVHMLNNQMQK